MRICHAFFVNFVTNKKLASMSSCIIHRNNNGVIQDVSTRDGNKSILFDKISNIPFIGSVEKALDLYLSTLTDKFKEKFGDWESSVAKNKKAVNTIRYQVMDNPNSDNIVGKAKTMANPILVKKTGDKIGERELYTTDLSKPGELYLYDENVSDVVDMEGASVPEDVEVSTLESEAIANNPNPVIDMTLISGEQVKAISPSHEVIDTKTIEAGDTASPFTYNNGEPKLFFLSGRGNIFDNYDQALQDTGSGDVEVGFLSGNVENVTSNQAAAMSSADVAVNGDNIVMHNKDAFIRVASIDSSSDINTYHGLVNELIRKGYVSGSMEGGFLVGKGANPKEATYNAHVAIGYIRLIPGYSRSTVTPDGRVAIVKSDRVMSKSVMLSSSDGGVVSFSKEDIKRRLNEGKYEELKKYYPDIDILSTILFMEDNELYHSNKAEIIENEKNRDRDLRRSMMQVLSRLGVSVVKMSDYIEKYKEKHGSEPSAMALADIGNRLIALADRSGVEDLTEEVFHFLVESYNDQIEIERLLPEVENTQEWGQYSGTYFDIYGKKYSGEKLTDMVRREVLGKVLRNEFLNRFDKVSGENTFFDRLLELFKNMVERIQDMFDSSIKKDFDSLVEKMADNVLSDDPSAFDIKNLDGSEFVLYSVDQKAMQNMFEDARTKLQAQLMIANRSKSSMASQLRGDISRLDRTIEALKRSLDEVNTADSVNGIVTGAEAQVNFMSKLVAAYKNEIAKGSDEAHFDLSDQQNMDNINTLMLPMAKELRGFLNNEDIGLDPKFKKSVLDRIDTVVSRIEALNSDVNALMKHDIDSIVDRHNRQFNVKEEGKQHVKNFLSRAMKDITWFSRWYGTLEHSSNPILGMLMNYITKDNYVANLRTQDDMNPIIRMINEKGMDIKSMENLLQKDGGRYSAYLKSRYDFPKFRRAFERAQVEAIKAAFPDENINVDEAVRKGYVKIGDEIFSPNINGVRLNFLDISQREAYEKSMNEWLSKNQKRRYKDGYYEKVEEIYKNAEKREDGTVRPISDEARRITREISSRSYQLKRRFMENGKVNWTKLYADSYAAQELKEIGWSRRAAASFIDPVTGRMKEGKELAIAEDIRAINKAWADFSMENKSEKGVKKEFLDEIWNIQRQYGTSAAFDFLVANSDIQFSDKFWGSLGESRSKAIEKILDEDSSTYSVDFEGNRIPKSDMESLDSLYNGSNGLRALQNEQSEILRMYRGTSLPGEINYDLMSQAVKDRIMELQLQIQYKNQEIYSITKDPAFESSVETEYTTNMAFDEALKDSSEDIVSFCKKHATAQNQVNIDSFRNKINDIKRGRVARFSRSERRVLSQYGFSSKNLSAELAEANNTNPDILDEVVGGYAKSLVLPYFKRFAPSGYSEWLSNTPTMDVSSFVRDVFDGKGEGVESFMEIRPEREWQEEGSYFDQYLNQDYNENSDYGYYQPSDEYLDPEYDDYFGMKNGIATQNKDEWDLINHFVELKRKALGVNGYNEGERNRYNLYEIPHVSKSTTERVFEVGKGLKSFKNVTMNSIRDLLGVRVDDPIYGQNSDLSVDGVDTTQFRVIPKYYLRELENKSDLSHDLARSYTLFMMQANLYSEKMNTIGDVMGMQQLLLNAKFEKGVIPKASNTYNMFKDWVDSHYYGIKSTVRRMEFEVGGLKVDVSKLANSFDKFVRFMNLAYSIPVAATAAVTGQLNMAVEGAVGQYVNFNSLRFADKELLKMSSGYISDIGNIDRRNKLYVLGERMGVYNMLDRTKSAGYNRIVRVLGNNVGFEMMEVLNAPLAPKLMIAVMDDTRMGEDGKFYRFNSFSKMMKEKSLSSDAIKAEWEKLRSRSLYNILEVKDGKVSIKEGFDVDVVQRQMVATQREIRSLSNICDGTLSQEDKSAATRNWMLNFTMAHRGWFQLAAMRRYKKAGYNYSTNQMEEGTHRTLFRFMLNTFKMLKEDNLRNLFSTINEEWAGLSDYEKTNIYRTMIDMVVFLGGSLVMMAAMGNFDDDDDDINSIISGRDSEDSWLASFASYIAIRSVNEMYSQLPFLLEINAVDTMYNPFPVMQKLRDIVMPKNWSLDEVSSGSYEGETKLWRLFCRQTFLKQWYSMKSAEDVERTKKGWLLNNPIMFFKKKSNDEGENEILERLKGEELYN